MAKPRGNHAHRADGMEMEAGSPFGTFDADEMMERLHRQLMAQLEAKVKDAVCLVTEYLEETMQQKVNESHDGLAMRLEDFAAAKVDQVVETLERDFQDATFAAKAFIEQQQAAMRVKVERLETDFATFQLRQDSMEATVKQMAAGAVREALPRRDPPQRRPALAMSGGDSGTAAAPAVGSAAPVRLVDEACATSRAAVIREGSTETIRQNAELGTSTLSNLFAYLQPATAFPGLAATDTPATSSQSMPSTQPPPHAMPVGTDDATQPPPLWQLSHKGHQTADTTSPSIHHHTTATNSLPMPPTTPQHEPPMATAALDDLTQFEATTGTQLATEGAAPAASGPAAAADEAVTSGNQLVTRPTCEPPVAACTPGTAEAAAGTAFVPPARLAVSMPSPDLAALTLPDLMASTPLADFSSEDTAPAVPSGQAGLPMEFSRSASSMASRAAATSADAARVGSAAPASDPSLPAPSSSSPAAASAAEWASAAPILQPILTQNSATTSSEHGAMASLTSWFANRAGTGEQQFPTQELIRAAARELVSVSFPGPRQKQAERPRPDSSPS